MKTPLVCLALIVSALALSAAEVPKAGVAPYSIPNSEVRELPKNPAGRHYQLLVGLPESYAKEPTRRYPVVFVTDGYWDFTKITAAHGSLVYDKVVPEFITVGLGYVGEKLNYGNLRMWELSPVPFGDNGESTGKAAEFLRTIETEIIPFIDREYRTDPATRILGGASLGGLFTLYSMYTKPHLFQGYIAATPAVALGNEWLFGYEETFAKSGKPLKARLYMSVGGNENPGFMGSILRFNQRLASRSYDGFTYDFRIIDGERHAGMQLESYVRGLRYVFAPQAPQTGPSSFP